MLIFIRKIEPKSTMIGQQAASLSNIIIAMRNLKLIKNRRRADYLISQNYLEHELFVQSYNEMKQLEETLTGANIFSLCHNDFSERTYS